MNERPNPESGWDLLNVCKWVFPAAACLYERSSAYRRLAAKPERLRMGLTRRGFLGAPGFKSKEQSRAARP
jgi:hypothetical protein